MEYVASSQYQHPRACSHGLCGRKKPRSRETVSSDTLNIDILVVGRTPKLEQNESPGAKTSDNLKNQHVGTGRQQLPVRRYRIQKVKSYTGGSNLMLIMLLSLSIKNLACGDKQPVSGFPCGVSPVLSGSTISILLGASWRLLLR